MVIAPLFFPAVVDEWCERGFDPILPASSIVLANVDDLIYCAQLFVRYSLCVGDFGHELPYSLSKRQLQVCLSELELVASVRFVNNLFLLFLTLFEFLRVVLINLLVRLFYLVERLNKVRKHHLVFTENYEFFGNEKYYEGQPSE